MLRFRERSIDEPIASSDEFQDGRVKVGGLKSVGSMVLELFVKLFPIPVGKPADDRQ
jgi:hypothetical protein